MNRDELSRLSKDELVELVLQLQRPAKTSRTSSKPPSTDRKEKRQASRPGGAKPGHKGHFRILAEQPDRVTDHRPDRCSGCGHISTDTTPHPAISGPLRRERNSAMGQRLREVPVRSTHPTADQRRSLRCSLLSVTPRHELVEARDLVISDATEGGGEPCLRINAVQLGGFDQRIGDGGGLGRAF